VSLILDGLNEGWQEAAEGRFGRGFFNADFQLDSMYGINSSGKMMPLVLVDALGAYMDLLLDPGHDQEETEKILAELQLVGQALAQNADLSVYGHFSRLAPETYGEGHRQFPWVDRAGHYTTSYLISGSAALAQIARRTHDVTFLVAAERNLQWILGKNPMASSYVGGLEGRMGSSFTSFPR